MDEPPSSPPTDLSTPESALAYYKSQYEQLEHELAEFQASSQELEAELEKDVEAAEKRERVLQEKAESLGFEVEEWKVCLAHGSCRCTLPVLDLTVRCSPNTSSPKPRRTRRKTPSRKRSPHFEIQTGHYS